MPRIPFPNNFVFEKELLAQGHKYVAGIDEVGRGPLAGPFVAGAVILDLEKISNLMADIQNTNNDVSSQIFAQYKQITDSKLISARKRDSLAFFVKNEAISYSIFEISNERLDEIGMSKTTEEAFLGCLNLLTVKPSFVLTDAFKIKQWAGDKQKNLIEGDKMSLTISAASIIAKVHRDQIMIDEHNNYPEYDFINNKGYGTKKHLEALSQFGPCKIHRKSFSPVGY